VDDSDPWHWINRQPSGSSHAVLNSPHHYYKEFTRNLHFLGGLFFPSPRFRHAIWSRSL